MNKIAKLLPLIALFTSGPSSAVILSDVKGDAKDDVLVGCDSCCWAQNNSNSKVIDVKFLLALGASATMPVRPGEKKHLIAFGQCTASSAFGVVATYRK